MIESVLIEGPLYSDTEIHEELCCLKPMYGTTKGEDILKTFTDHFEERGVDIRGGWKWIDLEVNKGSGDEKQIFK